MGRKAKVPASSAKALQVCGDTSKLGVSAADIFAQFDIGGGGSIGSYSTAPEPKHSAASAAASGAAASASVSDAEVSVALHAIQKKDSTTRLRGVAELQQLISDRPQEVLKEACGPFLHIYRRTWPLDAEPRVREGLQRCLQALAEALQRDFAKHLRAAFPTWLCSMFDTHTEVAQAARKAFVTVFPTDEKRRGVFRHCQAECLSLVFANLRHSEASLHDELGLAAGAAAASQDRNLALERQDRYARVISASLSGLGELAHVCASAPPASAAASAAKASEPLTFAELERAFTQGGPCYLWSRLAPKQPMPVRRAAAECLVRILQSPCKEEAMAAAAVRSTAIGALTDEALPAALAATLLCSFARAGGSECWEGLNAAKALWPQVVGVVRRVAAQDAAFLTKLPELLEALPSSAWGTGRAEALLQAMLEALEKPRAPAADLWRAYFAALRVAAQAGAPAAKSWRLAPADLYLGVTPAAEDSAGGEVPACKAPAMAFAALPNVLKSELPSLLGATGGEAAAEAAGQELLAALDSNAPAIQVPPATGASRAGGSPWDRWLALLAPMLSHAALQDGARDLVAKQFRRLLGVVLRWRNMDQASGAREILDAIGSFTTLDTAPPQPSWSSLDPSSMEDAVLKATSLPAAAEGWPADATLLCWPLLPLWGAWFQECPGGELARLLGDRVIRPLLRAAKRRHGSAFPSSEMRDIAIDALFGPLLPNGAPAEEADAPVQGLGAAVHLVLDCLPTDLGVGAAPSMQKAVTRLGLRMIRGNAVSESAADESALALALKPGGMSLPHTQDVLRSLVSAMEDLHGSSGTSAGDDRMFRLALVAGGAIAAHLQACKAGGEGDTTIDALRDMRLPIAGALLAALANPSRCMKEAEPPPSAWALLPDLLQGPSAVEVACKALGALPTEQRAQGGWLRALQAAAKAANVPAASLFCACRGGMTGLQLRGVVVFSDLQTRARASAKVLEAIDDPATLGDAPRLSEVKASLAWEVLVACAASSGEASAKASAVWAWLATQPQEERAAFLKRCAAEAAEEGRSWRVLAEANPSEDTDAGSIGPSLLHGVGILRQMLCSAWPDCASAEAHGYDELLHWALSCASNDHSGSPAWGHAVAAVVARCADVQGPAGAGRRASEARAQWRAALKQAASSQGLSAPLLVAASEVERWVAQAEEAEEVEEIEEVEEAEEVEVIDVTERSGLTDLAEKLLRWAQAKNRLVDRDALALLMASIWPDVESALPDASGPSKTATRFQRHAVEILAEAAKASSPPMPGALRLVGAMSRKDGWPDSLWPQIVQAFFDADSMAAGSMLASPDAAAAPTLVNMARGFQRDVLAAAQDLLQFVPIPQAVKLVPLLQAHDEALQGAAAARLRRHSWIPLKRAGVSEAAQEVLQQLDGVFQDGGPREEDSPPPREAAGSRTRATCSDVASMALTSVVGRELASEAWAVEGALAASLSWMTGVDDDDSGDEDKEEEHEDVKASVAPSAAASASGKTGSTQRSPPATDGIEDDDTRMPTDCRRRCVAVLAAWELLLLGVQEPLAEAAGTVPLGAEKDKEKEKEGAAPMEPPELLVSALQVSPDELPEAGDWASPALPALSDGCSPLRPLLSLLCLVLTCGKVGGSGNDSSTTEAQLAAAVAAAATPGDAPDCSAFALSARVLLLLLRAMPVAVRSFWEQLPRRRDREHFEHLVARCVSPALVQVEAQGALELLDSQVGSLPDIEATMVRRPRQLVLRLSRDDLKGELCVQLPESFPLRAATAEQPGKMPGIPESRIRNWMLQARLVLNGRRPMGVGRVMFMWARSFAFFFKGVEDCPICYNVVHLTTSRIPQKSCPTCKHKFHSECLYHWFKTSEKTTCPLCNQPF